MDPSSTPPEQEQNPYEATVTECSVAAPEPKQPNGLGLGITEVLVLVLLLPAFLSNALLWGLILLEMHFNFFSSQGRDFIVMSAPFVFVPAAGVIYGLSTGTFLYYRRQVKNQFLHPGIQALFQPFWFFLMITGGCICAFPFLVMIGR